MRSDPAVSVFEGPPANTALSRTATVGTATLEVIERAPVPSVRRKPPTESTAAPVAYVPDDTIRSPLKVTLPPGAANGPVVLTRTLL